MKLRLRARVNRSDARSIRHALEQLSAKGSVRKAGDEFVVEAEMGEAELRMALATFILRP
jgi:repressor of nif and glnA expression